ncbi:hypothetical protein M0R45_023887 [Rubus argutus]|uniref:Uncharacterized protein n=1 Tax=Rubus argutus TaxID=59490 RepID=A0AAW1WTL1_RUBAR
MKQKQDSTKGPVLEKRIAGGILIRESGGEVSRRHTKADVQGNDKGKGILIALDDSDSDSDSDPLAKKKDYASSSSQHPPLGGKAEPIHPSDRRGCTSWSCNNGWDVRRRRMAQTQQLCGSGEGIGTSGLRAIGTGGHI